MNNRTTVIDPSGRKGDFRKLENIKDFISVENVEIKNLNSITDWSILEKFSNVRTLGLSNCLVDKKSFFEGITNLNKLSELSVDSYCFFQDSEEKMKTKIKFSSIKKFIFVLPGKGVPDLDLPGTKEIKHNFIHKYLNFPSAFDGLEEIEFINYENYLDKIKKDDPYNEYSEEKEIYDGADIYNLSRLKSLNNIKFCKTSDEIYKKELILDKIFKFPNHKTIKINNLQIKQIKEKLIKGNVLYLDFTFLNYEDRNRTNVNFYSKINDALEVHYPSQHYQGYTDRFNEALKQGIKHVIIGPTYDFLKDSLEEYSLHTIDFVKDKILKIKSLESITFEFDESTETDDNWQTYSGYSTEFIKLLKYIISKKIKVVLHHKDLNSSSDFDERFAKYLYIFSFFVNIQANNELKNYLSIKNLELKDVSKFFNDTLFNKVKTIMVIDNQSESKFLEKFRDIEMILENNFIPDYIAYGLYLNDENDYINFSKIKGKKEESFKWFFEEEIWYGNQIIPVDGFERNPGKCIIIVKKSFLDNSKKIVFNNLEDISFQYIGKISYDNYEKIFKNKTFSFPKSINYNSVKQLFIYNNPPVKLNSLDFLDNLEKLYFYNYIDESDKNSWIFPKLNKLKHLDLSIYFPFQSGKDRKLRNIEQCKNLEEIHSNVGHCVNYEDTRWVTIDVDLTGFKNLKNLKKLDLGTIDQTLVKNLEKLETLEEFELINPCMITENMRSEDDTVHDPMTEKDLEFLKHSEKLKKLRIYFPRHGEEKININPEKFFSFINPNLEDINIMCSFGKDELHFATDFYREIINRFKTIKNIRLDINCLNAPELKYDEKVKGARDIAHAKQEKNAKNPVKVDFKDLINHKSLEDLDLGFDSFIGTRLFNIQEILNLKAKKISISQEKFKTEDLEKIFDKIATKREKFLLDFNKKNKGEEVLSYYKLDEENKKLYDEVEDEDENELEIGGSGILNILVKRIKKNNTKKARKNRI
jgi:hypothetical protein